jgi:signal transduction histidine kinase
MPIRRFPYGRMHDSRVHRLDGQPRDPQQRLLPQQSAGQVPAMAQQSDQIQAVQRLDAEPVQMQTQQQMESQQFLSQQVQTAGPQQDQQDLIQIRIEPIVPVWVSEPKSDLPFKGQVYFVRHVQFEQTHLMQGFRLDQASLLGVIRDATDRLLRRGMGYSLNPADAERAAYTAFLDFGFGELPLNLLELDPGGIARDMGRLRSIYSIIFGVVFAATVAAIFGLGRGLTEQLRLSRKKDDFLSAVSHELRTPLTTIRMYTEMLEKDWVSTESKRSEYYGIMRQESERLTRLIENVLDFSRIQRGRKQYAFKAGDFNRIVGDVIEMMTPCAQRAGFTIQRDLQYIESFCFDADAVMQIVINLLDNAIKYARDAQDKTIFIRTKTDGKIVQIEVEDRGPGIPRNERTKIFDEFYRIGDESRRETTGTGLGLALVKRFAEAHRGGVAVFAANPCGALFRVGLSVKA